MAQRSREDLVTALIRGIRVSSVALLLFSSAVTGGQVRDGVGKAPTLTELAFVFSPGYGTIDHWPKDPARFEDVVGKLKGAGFNTIHCVYRDWRVPICRKHGVKMMIDVLAWHDDAKTDIRRNAEQRANVKAICEKVRHEPAVWGYNLWNERLGFFGRPDGRDLNAYLAMLRKWDPTHPVWVGTYRNYYPQNIAGNPGVFAYYDYHWRRGMHWHFALLEWYQPLLNQRGGYLGRWILVSDYNRNMYTLNTSIACGLKVVIWFIGGPWNPRTGQWNGKHHLVRIGRQMQAVFPELAKIGRPVAVYSTPTTRTPDNKDKKPGVDKPLKPFPADHWLQVKQGEAVVGFFAHQDGGDAVYFANHNAFAGQGMVVALKHKGVKAWRFDRRAGKWAAFVPGELFSFRLAPGDGELFRFQRPKQQSGRTTRARAWSGTRRNSSGSCTSTGRMGPASTGTWSSGPRAQQGQTSPGPCTAPPGISSRSSGIRGDTPSGRRATVWSAPGAPAIASASLPVQSSRKRM